MTFQKIILVPCEYRPIGTFYIIQYTAVAERTNLTKIIKEILIIFDKPESVKDRFVSFKALRLFFLLFYQHLFTILKFQFGFEISDFGIFLGRKICQVFFWVA